MSHEIMYSHGWYNLNIQDTDKCRATEGATKQTTVRYQKG